MSRTRAYVGIFCFLAVLAVDASGEQSPNPVPIAVLPARDKAYIDAPVVSIPLKASESIEYYTVALVENEELGPGALKQREFHKDFIAEGDVLEINAYLIADRAADAFADVEKGPDAPIEYTLKQAFNGRDTETFFRYVKKLAEQRKAARTKDQLREMAQGFGHNPDNPLAIDYYALNDYLYGTGFIEVSSKKLKQANPSLLYYVPMAALDEGKVRIDLGQSKLEVLKGLTYFAFAHAPSHGRLAKEAQQIQSWVQDCAVSACSQGEGLQLGDLMGEVYSLLNEGRHLELSAKEGARLNLRKQLCALNSFFSVCSSTGKQAQRVRQLLRAEGVTDCLKSRSLLKGIRVKQTTTGSR